MSTQTLTDLNIDGIIQQVEGVSGGGQKIQKAFQSLAQQMQQSGNPQAQHWGQQLQQGTPQLVKACQQS